MVFLKIYKLKILCPVKFVDRQLKYILFDCFYIVVLSFYAYQANYFWNEGK